MNTAPVVKISDTIRDIANYAETLKTLNESTINASIKGLRQKLLGLKKHPDFTENLMPQYAAWEAKLKQTPDPTQVSELSQKINLFFKQLLSDNQVKLTLNHTDRPVEILYVNKLDLFKNPYFRGLLNLKGQLNLVRDLEVKKLFIDYLQTATFPKFEPKDFQKILELALFAHEAEDLRLVKFCQTSLIVFLDEVNMDESSYKNILEIGRLSKILPKFYRIIYREYIHAKMESSKKFLEILNKDLRILNYPIETKKWQYFKLFTKKENKYFAGLVAKAFLEVSKKIKPKSLSSICFFKLNLINFMDIFFPFIDKLVFDEFCKIVENKFPKSSLIYRINTENIINILKIFAQRYIRVRKEALKLNAHTGRWYFAHPPVDLERLFEGFPKDLILESAQFQKNKLFIEMCDCDDPYVFIHAKKNYLSINESLVKLGFIDTLSQKEAAKFKKEITPEMLKKAKENVLAGKYACWEPRCSTNFPSEWRVGFQPSGDVIYFHDFRPDPILKHTINIKATPNPFSCSRDAPNAGQMMVDVMNNLYQKHLYELREIVEGKHPTYTIADITVKLGDKTGVVDCMTLAAAVGNGAWTFEDLIKMLKEENARLKGIRGSYETFPPKKFPLINSFDSSSDTDDDYFDQEPTTEMIDRVLRGIASAKWASSGPDIPAFFEGTEIDLGHIEHLAHL